MDSQEKHTLETIINLYAKAYPRLKIYADAACDTTSSIDMRIRATRVFADAASKLPEAPGITLQDEQALLQLASTSGAVSAPTAAILCGYTGTHIRALLRSGTVEGKKLARDWMIDPESLLRYLYEPNKKPGPKKKQ
jgi:hypothetical protein